MRRVLLPLVVLAATACSSYSYSVTGPTEDWSDPTKIDYNAALGIDLASMHQTASGVYWQDLEAGSGDRLVQAGDLIVATYSGYTPDGYQFAQGTLQPVTLDSDNALQGWIDGLQGMKAGGSRVLVIPPALAFGQTGYGIHVPPNSTVIFFFQVSEIN